MALNQAKVLTVTSVKGGTGKTTTVLNLAGIFSMMEKRVLIIDLDLYSGGIAASLNISNDLDVFHFVDDLNNNRFDYIENYVVSYNEQIDVLPSPKDPRYANKINRKYINIILSKARLKYDVVLIDTNHFMNEMNLATFDQSDQILFVMTNDLVDLKNMKTMISILNDMEVTNFKVVLNEARDQLKDYYSKYDIAGIMKDKIDFTIPKSFYLRDINQYVINGVILTLDKKIRASNKQALSVFEAMAKALLKDKS